MSRFRTNFKKIFFQKDTGFIHPPNTHQLNDIAIEFQEATYEQTLKELSDSFDLVHRSFNHDEIHIIFLSSLVDSNTLEREILSPLREISFYNLEKTFQQSLYKRESNQEEVINGILDGNVAMYTGEDTYLINVSGLEERAIAQSETETVINGPHDSFNETLKTNVSLIRRRVRSPRLKMIQLSVGEISKSKVLLIYIDGIAHMDMVNHLKERIQSVKVDSITDSNVLIQIIDDHHNSPFPQFYTTERPDIAVSKLYAGKIIGLVDDSPNIFCTPSNFFDFFESPDDYNQRWIMGTMVRILRYMALFITLILTAFYVSICTFHYEMIPQSLLQSIMQSRSRVPFPPLVEAIFLEIVIEFLREAGARLPTKIGQTIGIVGGIVIGQAAVEAGITSNILIIVVAISAIASFIVPSYIMSASIRIIRFLFILMAGFLGNIGIFFVLGILTIHLTGLTNLSSPYFMPVSPTFFKDWMDSIVRGPFYKIRKTQPAQSMVQNDGEQERN
ncbi:spore germination protein [Bacillus sp. AFS041924]|uniref:spore germination protein n=1 Tax=Bacillus sp. AFS041924 TaxID=2033503 RepID=UPI000BFDE88A|nr:spore germination protein [Bacillus sp. AFS041924]PGS55445.1 spore germination protein [Bacillus sp. AFS041924]